MINWKINGIQIPPILRYLLYSAFVTIIDTTIVWILYRKFSVDLVTANSIGVITGFVIHYTLSSKSVFQTELGFFGFVIYLGTFLIGLFLADGLIYCGEHYLFQGMEGNLSFLFSKGFSLIIPFYVLFFIRKNLFERFTKLKNLIREKM